jgi:uncharacterized protein YjbJ (UPF0337 family)
LFILLTHSTSTASRRRDRSWISRHRRRFGQRPGGIKTGNCGGYSYAPCEARAGTRLRTGAFWAIGERLMRPPSRQEAHMDWNRIEGNWKQFKGKIKEQWGNLTDDDIDRMEGSREQFEGKIQEKYGIGKDQAKRNVDDWLKTLQ